MYNPAKLRDLVRPANARRGVAYEGLIATRCAVPNFINGASQSMQCKSGHVATDDIFALKIAVANFYFNNDAGSVLTVETGPGSPTTVTASVEYPAGFRRQITFPTGVTGIVPNGGVTFSNYVQVFIPRGATFWIHRLENNTSANIFCTWDDAGFSEGIAGGSGLSDLTMTSSAPSRVAGYSAPPLAIIGRTRRPSVLVGGDSINAGYLASTTINDGRRGIVASGFPSDNSLAFLNVSLADEEVAEFLAGSNGTARRVLFPYFSHLACNYGFNDLNDAGGGSKTNAQLQASLLQYYQMARAKNPKLKIIQCTLTPYATSTDSWATAGNQTVVGPTGQYLEKKQFNSDLRAGSVAGVDGYFDMAAYANNSGGPPADDGKWITTGLAFGRTTDGIHPNQSANDLISAAAVNLAQLHYP